MMKKKNLNFTLSLIVLLLCITACAIPLKRTHPETLVTPLNKLMPAVQSVIVYPEDGKQVPDKMILEQVWKDNPELCNAFKQTHIDLKHDQKNVVILICSPDGKIAWLEDASWTPGVDIKWFEKEPSHPCGFSLDPSMAPSR